jgi:hypothetical protein
MADEINTFPFDPEAAPGAPAALPGSGFKFTTEDDTHDTENVFSWEERFLDLQLSVTQPVPTQPFNYYDSSLPDAELGDLVETDHDRPPLGSFVFGPAYDGTCFIIDGNSLYYCKPKQPEYWPSLYFIEVGTKQLPLVTGVFHNGQPFVMSKTEIFYIQGTGHGTFFPLPMKAKCGAQSILGALSIAGKGIYHTGPDGIYLFANGADMKITEDSFEPIFRGESTQDVPGVASMDTSWLALYRNQLYFGYRSSGFDYPTNVIVVNLDTNRSAYFNYDDVEISAIANDNHNQRLIVGDADGFVRVIESKAHTTDAGVAISWEVQSKDYGLQTRKHFPRWAKYDVDASNAVSVTGKYILDDQVHHSHTITGSRNTRRRLIGEGNGNRASIRISGSGPATVYAVEAE